MTNTGFYSDKLMITKYKRAGFSLDRADDRADNQSFTPQTIDQLATETRDGGSLFYPS